MLLRGIHTAAHNIDLPDLAGQARDWCALMILVSKLQRKAFM